MTWYTYRPMVAVAEDGSAVLSGSGQVFPIDDEDGVAPLSPYDLNGNPLDGGLVPIEGNQLTVAFRLEDAPFCLWRSGDKAVPLASWEGMQEAAEDAATAAIFAQAAAEDAAAASGGDVAGAVAAYLAANPPTVIAAADWSTVTNRPSTFPPSAHTHDTGQVGATQLGQQLMNAASPQAARSAIGAGTGNGNSNLQIGAGATDAAAGNHGHGASAVTVTPFGSVTATNVQTALQQIATLGGGSAGAGDEYTVYYSGGAYPAVPASAPAGIKRRHFYGPVQYTGATWAGVLDLYTVVALT